MKESGPPGMMALHSVSVERIAKKAIHGDHVTL
jgi:hypothetical protein